MLVHGAPQLVGLGGVTHENVQAGLEAVHPMDEQTEVHGRVPGNGVPGDRTLHRGQLHARLRARSSCTSARPRSRPAVAGQQASPLQDDLSGRRPVGARAAFAPDRRRVEHLEPLRLAGRFARRECDRIDDLPGHRIVTTEPVRSAVPVLLGQLARRGRIEMQRQHALCDGRHGTRRLRCASWVRHRQTEWRRACRQGSTAGSSRGQPGRSG